MLKQIILGTRLEKIKYHGQVRFIVFACNFCHSEFSRMESYARKQVKIHKNACCFCSPSCRVQFFKNLAQYPASPQISTSDSDARENASVLGWIKNMLKK